MVKNPPEGHQRIVPYLMYADAPAAVDFLCSVFGFTEDLRIPMPDGKLGHAEVSLGGNKVMLASTVEAMGTASPRDLPGRASCVLVYVDYVDAHFQTARDAGAKVVSEPEDHFSGDRSYRVEDLEGHMWFFATHVKDVNLEDMP